MEPSLIDALQIRRRLGRKRWGVPQRRAVNFWVIPNLLDDGATNIILSAALWEEYGQDGPADIWVHASIAHPHEMPAYEELSALHRAVWPNGYAYQVFAPPKNHINIHTYALHLWGRLDGSIALPDFGQFGTI